MRHCMFRSLIAIAFGLGLAGTVLAQAPTPPATPAKPAAAAPAAAQPVIVSEFVAVGEPQCATRSVASTLGGKAQTHVGKPRPPQDCLGCGNWRCEWRFMFGGCRAFFDEGRFQPDGSSPTCRR